MNNPKIVGTVALIVGLALGYFGAHALAPAAATRTATSFTRGAGGFRGGSGPGGLLSGTVAAQSSTSITVDTRDGNSHVVILSPSTAIAKSVAGSPSDITVGSNVLVTGTTGSDGSTIATLVQLRPATTSPMMGQ